MNLTSLVAEANLAPSVHNTQPTRWRRDGHEGVILSIDAARRLAVGDAAGRDARLSLGAALYGTRQAAARMGLGVRGVETDENGARLALGGSPSEGWDLKVLERRMTWRRGFLTSAPRAELGDVHARDDTTLTADPALIDAIATLNDDASLKVMRDGAFREELLAWMRLSRRHPHWARDGLNADALGFGRVEAAAAGMILPTPVFEWVDRIGLGKALTGEGAKTRTAHWIAAFHRPEGEDPLVSGEAFYEMWLMLTVAGQAAWPMAVLADLADANAQVSRLLSVPGDHRLINVLRVGPAAGGAAPAKARVPAVELIDGA